MKRTRTTRKTTATKKATTTKKTTTTKRVHWFYSYSFGKITGSGSYTNDGAMPTFKELADHVSKIHGYSQTPIILHFPQKKSAAVLSKFFGKKII